MLTGSAAQTRSCTAPKEASAIAAPVFLRNLRRRWRFDQTTDGWALPVMSSSRIRSGQAARLVVYGAILARAKIVYNIVFNSMIAIGGKAGCDGGCIGPCATRQRWLESR